jgi:hypothetical protein
VTALVLSCGTTCSAIVATPQTPLQCVKLCLPLTLGLGPVPPRRRGRRGCCGGDDDVDGSAQVVATNSDRAGQETRVGRSYYTLDDAGGIVTDGTGRGAH